jgi:hypothetical protein
LSLGSLRVLFCRWCHFQDDVHQSIVHIAHMMCAFPYLPLSVLVILTSVFLASSIVISCTKATRSALYLEPFRFPLPYFLSSALDINRISCPCLTLSARLILFHLSFLSW